MAKVSRDPFARTEIHREFERHARCAWCDGRTRRGKEWGAFLHRVETDGSRRHEDDRTFCSVSCRESYHT